MKYLLILLLFPIHVYAESFYLVCEGIEEESLSRGKDSSSYKVTKKITVDDQFLKYDDITFVNSSDNFHKQTYDKSKEKIYFAERIINVNKKIVYEFKGSVDRVSGIISVSRIMEEPKNSSYFEGKCKKLDSTKF